jgi:hypothetical protein
MNAIVNTAMLESSDVRHAAHGRWHRILSGLAPELEPALNRPGRHVACPIHGGHDGFRLFRDFEDTGGAVCNTCGAKPDGFAVLRWLKGWDFPTTLRAVHEALGGVVRVAAQRRAPLAKPKRRTEAEDAQALAKLRRTWMESLPWDHPDAWPLRNYFRHRGLNPNVAESLDSLRFHPGLRYYDEDFRPVGAYPAMLALVTDAAGKALTFHRTFLDPNGAGKAPVSEPKKLMRFPSDRELMGGCIQLGPPGPVLGVAEGIETALAVRLAMGMPVWSAISSTFLEGWVPPSDEVDTVVIWADLDRGGAGFTAAERLRNRLGCLGLHAEVRLPDPALLTGDRKGVDWLDVLNVAGKPGFPGSPAGG